MLVVLFVLESIKFYKESEQLSNKDKKQIERIKNINREWTFKDMSGTCCWYSEQLSESKKIIWIYDEDCGL